MYLKLIRQLFMFSLMIVIGRQSTAQPGWQDLTEHFSYHILDRNQQPINFKTDTSYSIRIDSLTFTAPNVPSEKFERRVCCERKFNREITINDFTYATPVTNRNTVIVIGRGNDSMRLSLYNDVTLTFENGNFLFPYWANQLLGHDFFKGNVNLKNRQQSIFKISKTMFDEYIKRDFFMREKDQLADFIGDRLIQSQFKMSFKQEHISITNPLTIYSRPYWNSNFLATNDSNVLAGLVNYTLDTLNMYIGKNVFSLFNKSTNTITHWKPKNDPELFYADQLLFDSFNKKFYLTAGVRNKVKNPYTTAGSDKYPFTSVVYESTVEAKLWRVSTYLTRLFDSLKIEKFNFIDKHHQLAFKRQKIKYNRNRETVQGVYYLISNNRIVDSLLTPTTVYYDGNDNGYSFSKINDNLVRLGPWGVKSENVSASYKIPQLIKINNQWRFKIKNESRTTDSPQLLYETDVKIFKHFVLHNNKKLLFKNGTDSLEIGAFDNKILEKNNSIYIIQQSSMLVSFDAGKNWLYYPNPLSSRDSYSLLKMDDESEMSFYDMGTFMKYTYRFEATN